MPSQAFMVPDFGLMGLRLLDVGLLTALSCFWTKSHRFRT